MCMCMACIFLLMQELNLYSAPTFRDLSRPMGAQTPERLKQFEKRYNDWDDPTGRQTTTVSVFLCCSKM